MPDHDPFFSLFVDRAECEQLILITFDHVLALFLFQKLQRI